MMTAGFIGAGNMAYAIANGVDKTAFEIAVYDIDKSQYARFDVFGSVKCFSIKELCEKSDIIFLAVKPQNFEDVLRELAKAGGTEEKTFISIAAGISTDFIKKILTGVRKVIRVMPNTPMLVGKGACALSYYADITAEERLTVSSLFSNSSVCEEIPEEKMNEVVAVNGSSPAYLYLFAKAVTDAAVESGIDEEKAKNLICATMEGAAKMIREQDCSIERLIEMVSSKGGTTVEAMRVLYESDFTGIIKKAMKACIKRSYELQR